MTRITALPLPLVSYFLATLALSLSDRILGEPRPPPCCPWDACAPSSPSAATKPQAAAGRGMPARVQGWSVHPPVSVQISRVRLLDLMPCFPKRVHVGVSECPTLRVCPLLSCVCLQEGVTVSVSPSELRPFPGWYPPPHNVSFWVCEGGSGLGISAF